MAPLAAAGAGLGGLAGGLLYGSLGAAALFRAAAVTLAVGWLAANLVLHVWGGDSAAGSSGAGSSSGASSGSGAGSSFDAAGREGCAQRQASAEDGEAAALLRP